MSFRERANQILVESAYEKQIAQLLKERDEARALVREALSFVNTTPKAIEFFNRANRCVKAWEEDEK